MRAIQCPELQCSYSKDLPVPFIDQKIDNGRLYVQVPLPPFFSALTVVTKKRVLYWMEEIVTENHQKRVILLVLDSLGVGALPDAASYGDSGANTLAHIGDESPGLSLPHLGAMGLGNITPVKGLPPVRHATAAYGKALELSKGKDTTTGHWELAGIETAVSFAVFPRGFSEEFIRRFVTENDLPGVLVNEPASGTQVIADWGEEHLSTGKPIVYTSADSVFQIAAHEEHFGLERLYGMCERARLQCDEINVSRVIARPFTGTHAANFKRTENRRDYSIDLPGPTMMDHLRDKNMDTIGVGKIPSIYNYKGFSESIVAKNNRGIMAEVNNALQKDFHGLLFANFVDFDMLFGHRRDPIGYGKELEWFDGELQNLLSNIREKDLLIITADHGNDPTAPGTDHTREYIPVLAWTHATRERRQKKDLGVRGSFADVGQTILDFMEVDSRLQIGTSFRDILE